MKATLLLDSICADLRPFSAINMPTVSQVCGKPKRLSEKTLMNWASQTGMKETFPLNAICGDLRSFSASICGKPLDFQKKNSALCETLCVPRGSKKAFRKKRILFPKSPI